MPGPVIMEPTCMLPDCMAVTFKTAALIDPVKDAVTAAIELSVVTAPTGNLRLSPEMLGSES